MGRRRFALRRTPALNTRQLISQDILGHFGIETSLASQPVTISKAEELAKPKIRVGRDAATAGHDFTDALRWHADFLGQAIVADAHGQKKLFAQNLSGMYGGKFLVHTTHLVSVVIHDLNVNGVTFSPTKAHTELVVDAYAVLALAVTLQSFQPIAWWNPQVIETAGHAKLFQLATRNRFDVGKALGLFSLVQGLGVFAPEGLNGHAPMVTRRVNNVKRYYWWNFPAARQPSTARSASYAQ